MKIKIYEWKCPKCEKNICSLYKNQFDQNKMAHKARHFNQEYRKKVRENAVKDISKEVGLKNI